MAVAGAGTVGSAGPSAPGTRRQPGQGDGRAGGLARPSLVARAIRAGGQHHAGGSGRLPGRPGRRRLGGAGRRRRVTERAATARGAADPFGGQPGPADRAMGRRQPGCVRGPDEPLRRHPRHALHPLRRCRRRVAEHGQHRHRRVAPRRGGCHQPGPDVDRPPAAASTSAGLPWSTTTTCSAKTASSASRPARPAPRGDASCSPPMARHPARRSKWSGWCSAEGTSLINSALQASQGPDHPVLAAVPPVTALPAPDSGGRDHLAVGFPGSRGGRQVRCRRGIRRRAVSVAVKATKNPLPDELADGTQVATVTVSAGDITTVPATTAGAIGPVGALAPRTDLISEASLRPWARTLVTGVSDAERAIRTDPGSAWDRLAGCRLPGPRRPRSSTVGGCRPRRRERRRQPAL